MQCVVVVPGLPDLRGEARARAPGEPRRQGDALNLLQAQNILIIPSS